MRGRGKTNYLKRRIAPLNNLFIVDIRNEYTHIPAFFSFYEFLTYIVNLSQNENNGKGEIRLRFCFKTQYELIKLFATFASLQNCTIVIDEADAIFSVRKFSDALTNVFLGSRNNNVNMIFVAKRPFLLPILIRSQADEYLIFGTREKRDIDYLESRFQKEFPKSPFKLQMGEAVHILYDDMNLITIPKFQEEDTVNA